MPPRAARRDALPRRAGPRPAERGRAPEHALPPIAGGAVAVVLFGLSWIAGVLANVAGFLGLDVLARSLEGARYLLPLDGLWRGTVLRPRAAGDPPAGRERWRFAGRPDVANSPFFAASGPPPTFMLLSVLWIVVVLSLAIVSFRRREI